MEAWTTLCLSTAGQRTGLAVPAQRPPERTAEDRAQGSQCSGRTSTWMRWPGVCRSLREGSAGLTPGLAGLAPPAGGGEDLSSVAWAFLTAASDRSSLAAAHSITGALGELDARLPVEVGLLGPSRLRDEC